MTLPYPLNLILKRLDERSEHEQLEFLEIQKSIIVRDIGRHREQVQRIDERIEDLKSKIAGTEKK